MSVKYQQYKIELKVLISVISALSLIVFSFYIISDLPGWLTISLIAVMQILGYDQADKITSKMFNSENNVNDNPSLKLVEDEKSNRSDNDDGK